MYRRLSELLERLQSPSDLGEECRLRGEAKQVGLEIERHAQVLLSSEPSTDAEVICQLCVAAKLAELRAPDDLPHIRLINKAMRQAVDRFGALPL